MLPLTVAVAQPVAELNDWLENASQAEPFHQSRALPPPSVQTVRLTELKVLPVASSRS